MGDERRERKEKEGRRKKGKGRRGREERGDVSLKGNTRIALLRT